MARARAMLRERGVPEPGLEAAILLAGILRRSRAWLLAHADEPIANVEHTRYLAFVARRCRREPTAYILGEKQWLDITIMVNRNTLIPRPESELLAEEAMAAMLELDGAFERAPAAIDVGTGSGALAIALARRVPLAKVLGVDTSDGALRLARANALRLGAPGVRFERASLLESAAGSPDLVVANLPYVPSGEIEALAPELAYEPRGALDGGADGLDLIRALVRQARGLLRVPSYVLLECGHGQAREVARTLREHWPDALIRVRADLAGIDRVVAARLD